MLKVAHRDFPIFLEQSTTMLAYLGRADGVEEGIELGAADGVIVHWPQETSQLQGQFVTTSHTSTSV